MENIFSVGKYTFKQLDNKKGYRTFRVKCIETGDEKDSYLSYTDAANLLICQYEFSDAINNDNSKDAEYVRKIFSMLIGVKKSKCDEIVENEICNKKRLQGKIYSIPDQERFADYKVYKTEHFEVKILFENGLQRSATKV